MASEPMKYFPTLLMALFFLGGCSMAGNRYSCPLEDGVRCLSTREVYAQSHNGQTPKAVALSKAQKGKKDASGSVDPQPLADERQIIGRNDPSRPVRTASKVMRIWIAPWQDTQDDLVMPGYLYTEIEQRKWLYGLPQEGGASFFTPLKKPLGKPNSKEKR